MLCLLTNPIPTHIVCMAFELAWWPHIRFRLNYPSSYQFAFELHQNILSMFLFHIDKLKRELIVIVKLIYFVDLCLQLLARLDKSFLPCFVFAVLLERRRKKDEMFFGRMFFSFINYKGKKLFAEKMKCNKRHFGPNNDHHQGKRMISLKQFANRYNFTANAFI